MSADADILGADATGAAALPRRNGELVFDAPWESRAFGAAIALARAGIYAFDDMRDLLIEEISRWERTHDGADDHWNYYERWLAALERLLARRDLLCSAEIDERMRAIALHDAREHDHD
jgi:nitrile hydratase accessory protein